MIQKSAFFARLVAAGSFVIAVLFAAESALADGPALPAGSPAPGAPAAPSPLMQLVPFLLIFGVMYFMMIRPQQKKLKEQQELLKSLTVGDEVVTQSGFFGTIVNLTDKVVTLELAEKVRVRIVRSQIQGKASEPKAAT